MAIDLHKTPFNEGTKTKLSLYEDYIKEWLPVFLAKTPPIYKTVNIFDFFAGPGLDIGGDKGSPLITIELISPYYSRIINNSLEVNLFLNDKKKKKIKALKENISKLGVDKKPLKIHYSSSDFQELFQKYYPIMNQGTSANFLFLDQSGIKHITDAVFDKIIRLPATDFLFFISSSTVNRFYDHPGIQKYIRIPESDITSSNYLHIHRVVIDYYRGLIPKNKEYYLAGFSIQKRSNIYGLIFGSGHLRGIDKFLRKCWAIDPQRGEANFDIDEDRIYDEQPSLFSEFDKPKKLQKFENELMTKILDKKLITNRQVYIYTLSNGFLPKHARNAIDALIIKKALPKQRLNISYDSCKRGATEQIIKHH